MSHTSILKWNIQDSKAAEDAKVHAEKDIMGDHHCDRRHADHDGLDACHPGQSVVKLLNQREGADQF